jgi:hypothetical protein
MKAIKLKVKYSRLGIIADVLLQYADLCATMAITPNRDFIEDYKIRLSIATELYYKLQEKIAKRYPSENYKIPMELHHALVLQGALLFFVDQTEDDFKRNAIELVKNELNNNIVNLSKTLGDGTRI